MTEQDILSAIGSTEASTFSEFCRELEDCPEAGDREGWREVFTLLIAAEDEGLVIVERNGRAIDSLQLTEDGANKVRGRKDKGRPLFGALRD